MRPNNPTNVLTDCETIQELIPEYAFGLTDAEQTRLVDANLPACPDAAAQLADFQRMQADMRVSVPQVEPSADFESRLMAAIAVPAPAIPMATAQAKPALASMATPAPLPAQRWHVKPMWLVAAAVVALIVSNAVWYLRSQAQERHETDLLNQLANQQSAQEAFVIANTDGLRWVRLPPSEDNEANSKVVAVLMWNAESQIGLLYAQNLPDLTPNMSYQLWLTKGDKKVSAGTFTIDTTGKAAYLFHIYESIDNYTWARITVEPAQGSSSPSTAVVVVGQIALS